MITGIAAPADNRLQRTVTDRVPRHDRPRAAAEFGTLCVTNTHARCLWVT